MASPNIDENFMIFVHLLIQNKANLDFYLRKPCKDKLISCLLKKSIQVHYDVFIIIVIHCYPVCSCNMFDGCILLMIWYIV